MKREYKLLPCKDSPGFYTIDEPDFNVVLAVFRGEKQLFEGNWHLVDYNSLTMKLNKSNFRINT